MSRIEKLPYLLPAPERVRLKNWRIAVNDVMQPLGELLPEWDAAMPLHVSVTMDVDFNGVLNDCHLPSDAQLRLATQWQSSGTGLRGRGDFFDLDARSPHDSLVLAVTVDGVMLAKNVILGVVLVLLNTGSRNDQLAPKLPGSLLWSEEKVVLLEGEGTRFPMELIDFARSGWLPNDAAWLLDWNPHDLDQTVLGPMRLYLNSRHERVKRAVSRSDDRDDAVREAIRFDIARTLITAALDNDEFVANPDTYPDGTVGAAVGRLCRIVFPADSLKALQDLCQQHPHRFECQLQHGLKLFWEK